MATEHGFPKWSCRFNKAHCLTRKYQIFLSSVKQQHMELSHPIGHNRTGCSAWSPLRQGPWEVGSPHSGTGVRERKDCMSSLPPPSPPPTTVHSQWLHLTHVPGSKISISPQVDQVWCLLQSSPSMPRTRKEPSPLEETVAEVESSLCGEVNQ